MVQKHRERDQWLAMNSMHTALNLKTNTEEQCSDHRRWQNCEIQELSYHKQIARQMHKH